MSGGADPLQCRSCRATFVFLTTKAGKQIPINVEPTSERFRAPRPDEETFVYGEHQPHFVTCPNAGNHRRRR